MIDPFFFDRLMHAFTTTNSTPLSQAAAHAAPGQPAADSASEASACRALREAEAVVTAVLQRERAATQDANPVADRAEHG